MTEPFLLFHIGANLPWAHHAPQVSWYVVGPPHTQKAHGRKLWQPQLLPPPPEGKRKRSSSRSLPSKVGPLLGVFRTGPVRCQAFPYNLKLRLFLSEIDGVGEKGASGAFSFQRIRENVNRSVCTLADSFTVYFQFYSSAFTFFCSPLSVSSEAMEWEEQQHHQE